MRDRRAQFEMGCCPHSGAAIAGREVYPFGIGAHLVAECGLGEAGAAGAIMPDNAGGGSAFQGLLLTWGYHTKQGVNAMARPSPKKRFEFSDAKDPSTPETRIARALEFIAHHLAEIDSHLEKIALQQPGVVDKIDLQLKAMEQTLRELFRRP